MRLWRPQLIREMEVDQRELRDVGINEDEIIHHLVEKYHPSNPELRRVRHPLAEFLRDPENERMLLSEILYREEKRQFNRTQRLNQIIAVVKTPWQTVEGKKATVWVLHLVAGKNTDDALKKVRKIIEGNEQKEKNLLEKRRRERYFRDAARRLEQDIERRRRNDRRRQGRGSNSS